jgi:transposase
VSIVIQLVPQLKVLVALEPVDFRKGIDSLACVCREQFHIDPFLGTLFVFRNRAGTALKFLIYDGGGFWLCQKRFSQGKLQWWPRRGQGLVEELPAEQLAVLIYNGLPLSARMAEPWRRVS